MGLDMYLSATKYIGNWKHDGEDERSAYRSIAESAGLKDFSCPGSPHLQVQMCVAYWRKANAIHDWFVKNVQDGKDECLAHYVSREKLTELRDLCLKVLETKDGSLLPPCKGFFFGSTEVDDWYWKDMKETAATLTKLLKDKRLEDWGFSYRSSW